MMDPIPPHIANRYKSNQLEAESATSPGSKETPKGRVVMAPVTYGRSFILRWAYSPRFSVGQMLVLVDKTRIGSPFEVIQTFFPEKTHDSGQKKDRFYLGDRKLGRRYVANVLEIRMALGEPTRFRLLYPSGEQIKDWQVLDLSKLRLKTSEEQRAHITAFTGIIYKTQERKPMHGKKVHVRIPTPINQALNENQAKELKKKLAGKKPNKP